MVTNIMSLTGNGLKDWWYQRVSALIIAIYTIFMCVFMLTHPHMSYTEWQSLFSMDWFKISTVITIIAFIAHAWIGIWTITTDYIKCTIVRASVQWLVVLFLLAQFIFTIMIIWGQ